MVVIQMDHIYTLMAPVEIRGLDKMARALHLYGQTGPLKL